MLTPDKISKSGSESAHQKAFFAFCAYAKTNGFVQALEWAEFEIRGVYMNPPVCLFEPLPELDFIFHVPNGGSRGDSGQSRSIRGGNLKAEGVKDGVWDIFWPFKRGNFNGLWIEMKKPSQKPKRATSKGGVSDSQAKFGNFVYSQGFKVDVCYSWKEAVIALCKYIRKY